MGPYLEQFLAKVAWGYRGTVYRGHPCWPSRHVTKVSTRATYSRRILVARFEEQYWGCISTYINRYQFMSVIITAAHVRSSLNDKLIVSRDVRIYFISPLQVRVRFLWFSWLSLYDRRLYTSCCNMYEISKNWTCGPWQSPDYGTTRSTDDLIGTVRMN